MFCVVCTNMMLTKGALTETMIVVHKVRLIYQLAMDVMAMPPQPKN